MNLASIFVACNFGAMSSPALSNQTHCHICTYTRIEIAHHLARFRWRSAIAKVQVGLLLVQLQLRLELNCYYLKVFSGRRGVSILLQNKFKNVIISNVIAGILESK